MVFKKEFLKSFAKMTRACNFIKKETPTQVFSCEKHHISRTLNGDCFAISKFCTLQSSSSKGSKQSEFSNLIGGIAKSKLLQGKHFLLFVRL